MDRNLSQINLMLLLCQLQQQRFIMDLQILLLQRMNNSRQRQKKKRQRALWIRPWLLRRPSYGHYENLIREMALEDHKCFYNFMRMDKDMFNELLQRIGPRIQKKDTWYRKSLDPGLRLAITLRFLATGDNLNLIYYTPFVLIKELLVTYFKFISQL